MVFIDRLLLSCSSDYEMPRYCKNFGPAGGVVPQFCVFRN